jgi:carbamoyl-phosphate synthase large subunit
MNILFLGAGKRLSLLEYFQVGAQNEGIRLLMWAVERDHRVPITSLASVLVGPGFKDTTFDDFLMEMVIKLQIDLIIPNMDSATVSLSRLRERLSSVGTRAVVSEYDLCSKMEDKLAAQRWFSEQGVPTPSGDGYPRIAKKRFGFGSKDQFVAMNERDLQFFIERHSSEEYFVQPFISGQEYTVDAYVDRRGRLLAALSRKRLEVSAGEVDLSETHRHLTILELTTRLLSVPGWQGPVTLQFIDTPRGPIALEINPRFGGGVTHSIHCGLDMPRWLLREHAGLSVEPVSAWPDGSIMTRCRRDIFL